MSVSEGEDRLAKVIGAEIEKMRRGLERHRESLKIAKPLRDILGEYSRAASIPAGNRKETREEIKRELHHVDCHQHHRRLVSHLLGHAHPLHPPAAGSTNRNGPLREHAEGQNVPASSNERPRISLAYTGAATHAAI
jgi:hypothetical protein